MSAAAKQLQDKTVLALKLVRSNWRHDAQRSLQRAQKNAHLPGFRLDMRTDQARNAARRRPIVQIAHLGEFHQLKPTDAEYLKSLQDERNALPFSKEQQRLERALWKEEFRVRGKKSVAEKLRAVGIPSLNRGRPPGPPKLHRTPRTNPTPWQEPKRSHFALSDWKLREAEEIRQVRHDSMVRATDPAHWKTRGWWDAGPARVDADGDEAAP